MRRMLLVVGIAAVASVTTVADGAPKHKRGTLGVVAGTLRLGFSGDGGPARLARLHAPYSTAVDHDGNVYIADKFNNRIRKVDRHGKITTFAGTGKAGFSGDGGSARRARLDSPQGVALDSHDNLYIADTSNVRVRRVDARTGTITTFAGSGDYASPLRPDGDGAPATDARMAVPSSVAVDAHDNVYVAGVCSVRKVDTAGIISTVVGRNTVGPARRGCGFSGDGGPAIEARVSPVEQVAVDSAGNVYVADPGNRRVRVIRPNGIISTFAGNGKRRPAGDGGKATKARIGLANGVAVDGRDNVYIAAEERVRKVTPHGRITTVAGSGSIHGIGHAGDPARKIPGWGPGQISISRNGDLLAAAPSWSRVWIVYRLGVPVRP